MMRIKESENFIYIKDSRMNKHLFKRIEEIISELDCKIVDCTFNTARCYDMLETIREMDGEYSFEILLQKRGGSWQSTLM